MTAEVTKWWTTWFTILDITRLLLDWKYAQHKGSHNLHCVLKSTQYKRDTIRMNIVTGLQDQKYSK